MSLARKFAFVVPRFGEGSGGAETLVGALAAKLAQRGDQVQILTTCAQDNRTWENALPSGSAVEFGLPVQRFPVDARTLDIWVPLQIAIHDGMLLPIEDQMRWLEHSVNSSALYNFIAQKGASFDALFFAPYLFGTTFWGSLIHPKRSFLIPCLHDEQCAYVEVIASMFRQVRGHLFNAAPEQDLARTLYGDIVGGEVGMGFDIPARAHVERLVPYFEAAFPYVLYVGRKETGKNVQLLIDYFIAAKEGKRIGAEVKLVILGGGSFSDLGRPEALLRNDIIDLAHLSELDKQRLMHHALVLCQPSTNESFSIVLMEAWSLATPVIVHAKCLVTREHVISSGGGLYFGDTAEFAAGIDLLLREKGLRAKLALAGQRYVQNKYNWSAVLQRFDAVLASCSGEQRDGAAVASK